MTLRAKLNDFSIATVGHQTTPPDHISVREQPPSDDAPQGSIKISPAWFDARNYSYDDSESDIERRFPELHHRELKEGDFYDRLSTVFDDLRDRLTLEDTATLEKLSFTTQTHNSLLTDRDVAFEGTALVTVDQPVTLPGKHFQKLACDVLQNRDSALTPDQLYDVTGVFNDWADYDLVSVRATVETPHPHRYYANVDSVEDYITIAADDSATEADLADQETYEVGTHIAERPGTGTSEGVLSQLADHAQLLMAERTETTVEVDGDWRSESEQLTITDGQEQAAFWVRTPFDWP